MSEPLSVVELENILGPHLHVANAGLAPPLVLAQRYWVQKIVGKGARGLVCKGRDVRLDRDVAIKLYPADPALIREVEDNAAMTGSYAMIDPLGRFFSNVAGHHTYSRPILEVGVTTALAQSQFMPHRLVRRGGVYAW